MRITSISVRNFLGLASATVTTNRPITVITGPNGAGKSTLVQALRLSRDAIQAGCVGSAAPLDDLWSDAARHGSRSFEIRIGIAFTAQKERDALDGFYRAALLWLLHPDVTDPLDLAAALDEKLPADASTPLLTGTLVSCFDRAQRFRWTVGWEFDLPNGPVHLQVLGPSIGHLVDGPVSPEPPTRRYARELTNSTNDIVQKIRHGAVDLQMSSFIPGRQIDFRVERVHNASTQPRHVARTFSVAGRGPTTMQDPVRFAEILLALLRPSLQVTDNHRLPLRARFSPHELAEVASLEDGTLVGLEMHRLKNGGPDARKRFRLVRDIYRLLTGDDVDCLERVTARADVVDVEVVPVVTQPDRAGTPCWDVPVSRAGAGAGEALHLAVLLSDENRCVLLDEPAVHLSPTGQRRLLTMLRARDATWGQVLWITHNPDLVPVRDANELASIVRIAKRADESPVHLLTRTGRRETASLTRLLASGEVRRLLFAAGVLLVEGPTDLAALEVWLNADGATVPTPEEVNVLLLSVDGQNSFSVYVDLASQLGLPWAIVADGPALRPDSKMAKGLASLGIPAPRSGDDLGKVRRPWAEAGVFTLADQFGDDGTKAGEIEAFFRRVDSDEFTRAQRAVGSSKGARVGAAFAAAVACPADVTSMWSAALNHLGVSEAPV